MTTSSDVGNETVPSLLGSTSIGSILTPPSAALESNVDMPGRPRADRGICDAMVPSALKTAPRNEPISANGRSRDGGRISDEEGEVAVGDLEA
jgi:hypothetical protein